MPVKINGLFKVVEEFKPGTITLSNGAQIAFNKLINNTNAVSMFTSTAYILKKEDLTGLAAVFERIARCLPEGENK